MQYKNLLAALVAFSATATSAMPTANAGTVDPPPVQYGYDGPPINADFCKKAPKGQEPACRKEVEACDKKYDDQGRETQCAKTIKYRYTGLDASFCRLANALENDCRKEVAACDRKYDNEGRETACAKAIKYKYSGKDPNGPVIPPPNTCNQPPAGGPGVSYNPPTANAPGTSPTKPVKDSNKPSEKKPSEKKPSEKKENTKPY
ncbi:cellophane-induced protein 1 [Venturia nashicola]|nr:cellophane-induced protein 1 [Venturia nashicola]